ncbi:MAG: mechanosensitive ion channel family protein [Acidobacteriota bacterium]
MLDTILHYLRTPLIVFSGTPVSALTLLVAIFIVLCARIAAAIIGRSIERVFEARGLDRGLRFAVSKITRYVVTIIGVFVALGSMGVDTSAIMAGGAVLLVGIGFGLQKLAENFISGLLVLIERPVRKGDLIDAGGVVGTVDDIGLRATRVISRDGVTVIVPNANLMSNTVINYTTPTLERRIWVRIGVAYGTDLKLASSLLRELAEAEPLVASHPVPEVRCTEFKDSCIELAIVCWIKDAKDDLAVISNMNYAIDREFRAHGIAIPFPQLDVHTRAAS